MNQSMILIVQRWGQRYRLQVYQLPVTGYQFPVSGLPVASLLVAGFPVTGLLVSRMPIHPPAGGPVCIEYSMLNVEVKARAMDHLRQGFDDRRPQHG